MKSEIIFQFYSTWRGRWGEEEGQEIVIFSNFDNPANWPFQLKRYEITEDEDTYEQTKEEVASHRISKEIFERIKRVIAGNSALAACQESVHNNVMDGSSDEFYFSCDSFSKRVCGSSILSCGSYEEDLPAHQKTENYIVKQAVEEIEAILKTVGIDLF